MSVDLPSGVPYYAVIDVEALVLGRVDIVEQVGFVLVDPFGREVFGEKYVVYQPLDAAQIAKAYRLELPCVQKAIRGYEMVTRDDYVHSDERASLRWGVVRKRVVKTCQAYAQLIFAKGMALESRVFYGELPFWDLEWWGAPRYPGEVHDPLSECRFFSQFIPNLIRKPVYVC